MKMRAEIEKSIREAFPSVFARDNAVREREKEFADYAIAISAPTLGAETCRYQSMLLCRCCYSR